MSSDKRYDALRRALAELDRLLSMDPPPGYMHDHRLVRDKQVSVAAAADPKTLGSLIADYDALTARVEAAERDARRYRWLRDVAVQEIEVDHTAATANIRVDVPCDYSHWHNFDPGAFDAAIDSAMEQQKEEPGNG